ncbi:hypothetical protein Rsub_12924 [Raphidocelis subcapitata]|uniref:HYR domain-containing protein n=1 Tax=Raphidocelis subcapitata TaxID=307507 RepID=A0A2V0PKC1_9CHLO|nr:hypothetical protein Rsub_12924 [Raphidocelis subcapitata]|eukprot:GBG00167.1 hypothetical protein Rsub_12924 [Raphidocelis subcapitata]
MVPPVAVASTRAQQLAWSVVNCTATDFSGNTATGTFTVTINSVPTFVTTHFEATTNTPYLGASAAGKYAPYAFDVVDGHLSASIKTFLVNGGQQISLSGANAYIFPLGSTEIKNTATNSRGATAEELVTIVVADTTKPRITVAEPMNVIVTSPASSTNQASVDYADKCTATDLASATITYNPPSGSGFTLGQTTTVNCTATDSSGNTATGTFTVTVRNSK